MGIDTIVQFFPLIQDIQKAEYIRLLCTNVLQGDIAFELVSITDELIAEISNNSGSDGAFSTSDPSERIIRKKLHRKYKTAHPIELLVYTDGQVVTPDDVIIATILPWIGSIEHPFRKVWFMGERDAFVIWTVS